jgi:hypothetical protein
MMHIHPAGDQAMLATPITVINPSIISHEFFHMVNADVSRHIRSKLQAMDVELIDLELQIHRRPEHSGSISHSRAQRI